MQGMHYTSAHKSLMVGGNYGATPKINIPAAQTPLNMRKHTVHIIFVPPIRIFNILAGINGD